MTLTSVGSILLVGVLTVLYFAMPRLLGHTVKVQNGLLLLASGFFYACNLPNGGSAFHRLLPLLVLAFSILFNFFLAKSMEKALGCTKKRLLVLAIAVSVGLLAFFKYFNYALPSILGIVLEDAAKLALPLGISFYTFASLSYLIDVYRGDMPAEKSLLNWAVFVCFFATITSGPICRAQKLLPQLRKARCFEGTRTCDAFRLALFGFFKWIAIANILGLYVDTVFASLAAYSGFTLTLTAVFYAFKLYFEFAGYSDIARAIAMLLGLELPVNFKTPYFATNFSGFWNRWHITLSSWLQDYIFMPLVWGRWTSHLPLIGKKIEKPPMISSVALVFFISGFWHGSTMPFVFWGCLQAAYRVGEELLHRFYKKPAKRPKLALRTFKTIGVFCLWSASLVFFRIGTIQGAGVADGFSFLIRQFQNLSLPQFAADTFAIIEKGFYTKNIMVIGYLVFLLVVLFIGIYTDWLQCFKHKDRHISLVLATQKTGVRWACYYGLLLLTFVALVMQSGGFGTSSFAYGGF